MFHDFIKEIDPQLHQAFQDILNSYAYDNGGIYSNIQSYIELLFKRVLKTNKKAEYLGSRDSLGDILSYRFFQVLMEEDYQTKNLEKIREISKTANVSKHQTYIGFEDSKVVEYITEIYNLTFRIYCHDVRVITKPELKLEKQLNNKETIDKIAQVVKEEASESIAKVESVLSDLEDKKHQIQNRIEERRNRQEETQKGVLSPDQLRSLIFLKEEELADMQDLLELKYSKDLEQSIEDLSSQISDWNMQLQNSKFIDYNSADIAKNRNQVELQTIERQINDTVKELNEYKDIQSKASTNPKHFFNTIKKNLSCWINSSYISDAQPFRCIGFPDDTTCTLVSSNYFATIFNQLVRGKKISISTFLEGLGYDEDELEKIYQLEITVLGLIRNGFFNEDLWSINLVNDEVYLLESAIDDLKYRFDRLKVISDTFVVFPKVELKHGEYNPEVINIYFNVINPTQTSAITIQKSPSEDVPAKIWIDDFIRYKLSDTKEHNEILEDYLYEFFGFDSFREGQIEILRNALNNERTIGILTTGGGKSLIYQFVGLMQPRITLIVDPLVALINDQYRKMVNEFHIDRCERIISNQTMNLSAKTIVNRFIEMPSLFAYCSPERFQNREFRDLLITLNYNRSIGLIVLDEVHCLSEWGHDFRISYLMLTQTINAYCRDVHYLGLTATAAVNVLKDLQVELGIFDPNNIIFNKKLKRDNLHFKITEVRDYESMDGLLENTLSYSYKDPRLTFKKDGEKTNAIIVFFKQVFELKQYYEKYKNIYSEEITAFFGDFKTEQDLFIENERSLMFATKAFGMGVDKPNIRRTIHFGMPSSRENYFQEAGRGGRDGRRAVCELYTYPPSDPIVKRNVSKFLDLQTPIEELARIQQSLNQRSTDLSTNAYFMASAIDSVDTEVKNTVNTYAFLVDHRIDLEVKWTFTSTKSGQQLMKNQKWLYILHKIGVVRNWEVKYLSFSDPQSIEITVMLHQYFDDFEHIKESGIKYLTQYSISNRYIKAAENLTDLTQVADLIKLIREWYHNTFFRSRREQLANMVSFIDRYKNGEYNDEIQGELSQFFDVSKLIERRDSEESLTFEKVKMDDVIKKLIRLRESDYSSMRVTMDRLLETDENTKINAFTSLVYLLNNMYEDRNGKPRLEFALGEMEDEERTAFYHSMNIVIPKLSQNQKSQLFSTLTDHNPELFLRQVTNVSSDEVISQYQIKSLNQLTSEVL
jgi:ATP-dependent DNA helicase RecQ